MNKFIVTTTINPPTKATLKYCKIAQEKGWKFVIVGDLKTPQAQYEALEKTYTNTIYLSPDKQAAVSKVLSDVIGWKTIQRRNIGFVFAFNEGADVVATVDDDNVPYEDWGDNILVGKTVEIDLYRNTESKYFDPLSATNHPSLWHRGYPIEELNKKNSIEYLGKEKRRVLVQADLWDGDPDIDAICRLSKKPIVKFDTIHPYGANQIAPFNSQNTFLDRSVLASYAVLPFVGRMDDIWGAYILQLEYNNCVIYNKASVYQERNVQDLVKNLENEIIGYRNTLALLNDLENYNKHLPDATLKFLEIYRNQY
jgi:hypothetical protein